MAEPVLVLATADEIRAIAERAVRALAEFREADVDYDDPRAVRLSNMRFAAAAEALRFCAHAAGVLGDVSLLPTIVEALDAYDGFDDHANGHVSTIADGITMLLQAGAPADEQVHALATHEDCRVRDAVAEGLRPRGPAEIALLEVLARDPEVSVRKAARATLAKVREVPWWTGKFQSDPVARLAPEDRDRCKPALERLNELLDAPAWNAREHAAEVCELVDALPDALVVEVAEQIFTTAPRSPHGGSGLFTLMLSRPGGTDALFRMLAKWTDVLHAYRQQELVVTAAKALAPAPLKALRAALLDFVARAPAENSEDEHEHPATTVAAILGALWPEGGDAMPLVDLLLARPDDGNDYHAALYSLRSAIEKAAPPPPEFLARATEAHLAGYPGSWKHLHTIVKAWLEQSDPAALRGVAERAMLAEDGGTVVWGATQLLWPCYDPERDPPPPELIRNLYSDPRYQPLLFNHPNLLRAALPLARADLRAGRLDWDRAAKTLDAIDSLYGGLRDSGPMFFSRRRSAEEIRTREEETQREQRSEVEAFLTPEDPQGPPTDEEWAAYRALRARESFEARRAWLRVLEAVPPGPWEASDRALLDEGLARVRAGGDELALPVAWALAAKPSLEDLRILEELVAQHPDDGRLMVDALRAARSALGLPAIEGEDEDDDAPTGDEDDGSGEWMDEPDGDE